MAISKLGSRCFKLDATATPAAPAPTTTTVCSKSIFEEGFFPPLTKRLTTPLKS